MDTSKTVLVTGGAGFIGSHFVEMLFDRLPDHRIIVLDVFTYAASPDNIPERIRESLRFELVRGDIRDRALVDELVAKAGYVVHFAAESHVSRSIADDRPFFETDVLGTQTVFSAISKNLVRVKRAVHISTSEVYGTAVYAPMDEDHPLNPCTPYAAAKAGADRLVYAYRETYGIPVVTIRPFNNYGPRQHIEKVVPRFITAAILGEDLTVHGDGESSRDWVYVTDTCEAVYRALLTPNIEGNVINVGTGVDTSIREVASRIRSFIATSGDAKSVPERPGQVKRHISSVGRAFDLLGFYPRTPFSEGLLRTVEWYVSNPNWWRRLLGEREVGIEDAGRRLAGSW